MYYLDTSVLVAYYSPEKISDRVEQFLINKRNLAISQLTEIEFAFAITRKISKNEISQEAGIAVLRIFESHIGQKSYSHFPILANHYTTALKWITEFFTPHSTEDPFAAALDPFAAALEMAKFEHKSTLEAEDPSVMAMTALEKSKVVLSDDDTTTSLIDKDDINIRVIEALHLAISASNKATILTTDEIIANTAKKVGVMVELII